MSDETKCPFSKAMIARWCYCPHAKLYNRHAGKLRCVEAEQHRDRCLKLDDLLQRSSRFVLKVDTSESQLTHAQLMKIRCGGLLGMQHILDADSSLPPIVIDLIERAVRRFDKLENFPFDQVVKYIQAFEHRRKKKRD